MFEIFKAYNLSAALREIYANVSVQVISQQLGRATAEELAILSINEDNSWIREVYLLGDGKPVVHARVVAPHATYVAFKQQLEAVGNRFLGEAFLYQLPHTRGSFEYFKIDNQTARRSIFKIDTERFLVTECFLEHNEISA